MAKNSLYQTSLTVRRIVLYALLAIVVVIAVDTLLKSINNTPQFFNPSSSYYVQQSTDDTVEIPSLPISTLPINNTPVPTFVVDGQFPTHPDTAFVYTVEQPRIRLDYEANAVRTASSLGFTSDYTSLNGDKRTHLKWENAAKTRALEYNAEELSWVMRTEYFLDTAALQPKTLLGSAAAYSSVAKGIMNRIGLNSGKGLSGGEVKSILARLGSDALFTNPTNPNSANYVDANIHRALQFSMLKPVGQRPAVPAGTPAPLEHTGLVYKSDPRSGSMHMIISDDGTDATRDVYELDFVDFNYNEATLVREILSPEEAWTAVRQGEGKLCLIKSETSDYFAENELLGVERFTVNANETEFAYYEPEEWDGFVYPIYIFRGRADLENGLTADFVFYMDAIKRGVFNFQ